MRAFSHCQKAQPSRVKHAPATARYRPPWLSSGDSTPATTALRTRLVKACSEDAAPRWRGYMSRMASVRIGNTSATPNAVSVIGSTAHGSDNCGAKAL